MATRETLGDISPVDVYLNLQEQIATETGGVLPSVSSTDNGKILKVSGGKWAKGDESVELPTFPTTAGTYSLKLVVADGTPALSWEAQATT